MLTDWIVSAAEASGFPVQSTSIPGVAQRTGATTYYVEIYPEPLATLGERRPVLGLYPVPGHVDLVRSVMFDGLSPAQQRAFGAAIGRVLERLGR